MTKKSISYLKEKLLFSKKTHSDSVRSFDFLSCKAVILFLLYKVVLELYAIVLNNRQKLDFIRIIVLWEPRRILSFKI